MKRLALFLCALFLLLPMTGCENDDLKISVNENVITEYGDELDYNILYNQDESDEDIYVKEVSDFDKFQLGNQEVNVTFADKDGKSIDQKIVINVKDTRYPLIKIKKETITITEGDSFDANTNIDSVSDEIDGKISISTKEDITKSGYFINSNVNNKKAGTYTVDIIAYDNNGNNTEKSYAVNVKAKPKAKAPTKASTSNVSQNTTIKTSTGNTTSAKKTTSKKPVNKTTTTTQSKPSSTSQKKPSASTSVKEPVSNKVYIAGSGKGKRYHSHPSCSNMSNPIPITLSDAQARGYTACKKCY